MRLKLLILLKIDLLFYDFASLIWPQQQTVAKPRFVKFDKSSDGVEVGLISFTNDKTRSWYADSVADYYHDWFADTFLNWDLHVLIILGIQD